MITNTWKHATVGAFIMILTCAANGLISLIPNTTADFRWFGFLAIIVYCAKWEIDQENASSLPTIEYLRRKWLDIICDLAAGIGAAGLVLWAWEKVI